MITKTCAVSRVNFTITDEDQKFYQKINAPLPTLCPTERMRRRLAWRNERALHHRTCVGTGKKIISMYSPESGHQVYDNEYWWGDNWDGKTYGKTYDFNQPFWEQWYKLFLAVPKMARVQQGDNLNSRYTNCASYNKNCYLLVSSNESEDCLYGTWIDKCRDTVDCYGVFESELMYQAIECGKCYNVRFSQQIDNSNDVYHSYDCKNCRHIFGCIGLRGSTLIS